MVVLVGLEEDKLTFIKKIAEKFGIVRKNIYLCIVKQKRY